MASLFRWKYSRLKGKIALAMLASRRALTDVLFFLLWCTGFVFLAEKHVPWRDEYQSWLVSIRTHSPSEFFTAIRYERAPFMHYILSRGIHEFAALLSRVFPAIEPWRIFWSRLLSGAFSALTVGVLVFSFREQPRWLRYGVPLGILFVLDYGIISRGYIFCVFFLVLGARLRRRESPVAYWSCLLAAGSFHLFFTLISGALFVASVFEFHREVREGRRRPWQAGLEGVYLIGFLGLILFQRPPADSTFPTQIQWIGLSGTRVLSMLATGLSGFEALRARFQWNGLAWNVWTGALMVSPILFFARRHGFPVRKFFFVIALPLLIMSNTWGVALRHAGVLYIVALVLVLESPKRVAPWAILPSVALMFLATVRFLCCWNPFSPVFDFSGARELESRIGRELSEANSVLAADPAAMFFPVEGDLNINLIDPTHDTILSYPLFRKQPGITLAGWCETRLPSLVSSGKAVYLGLPLGDVPPKECGWVQKVFETTRSIQSDEAYVVFRAAKIGDR